MGIGASPGGNQVTATPVARLPQLGVVVRGIAQQITPFAGQLRGPGDPDRTHGHGQRPLPAIPPAVPLRLAPACFCVNRAMGG
jgi:hypothetical protein